jgi:hypothetical protein
MESMGGFQMSNANKGKRPPIALEITVFVLGIGLVVAFMFAQFWGLVLLSIAWDS